jgi:hypothetical protein
MFRGTSVWQVSFLVSPFNSLTAYQRLRIQIMCVGLRANNLIDHEVFTSQLLCYLWIRGLCLGMGKKYIFHNAQIGCGVQAVGSGEASAA